MLVFVCLVKICFRKDTKFFSKNQISKKNFCNLYVVYREYTSVNQHTYQDIYL